jgi:SAM-dependent methyltransferase
MDTAHTYDRRFFESIGDGSTRSARRIVPMVLAVVKVASVIDVGCGDGAWLAEFARHQIKDIVGVDGALVPPALMKIPPGALRRVDLSRPFVLARDFDLAISLEVAEHLAPARAAGFVADLVALAPRVLFSAAIPPQRGTHHVNGQWPDYWQGLFEARGYVAFDVIRAAVWNDDDVEFWYRQNTILYVRHDRLNESPELRSLQTAASRRVTRLIHPHLCDRWQDPSLRDVLAMIPGAAIRAIARRLHRSAANSLQTARPAE